MKSVGKGGHQGFENVCMFFDMTVVAGWPESSGELYVWRSLGVWGLWLFGCVRDVVVGGLLEGREKLRSGR